MIVRSWRFWALGTVVWMSAGVVTLLARPIGITLGSGAGGAVNALVLRLLVGAIVAVPIASVLTVRTRWSGAAVTAAAWALTSVASAAIVPESSGFTMAWASAGVSDALGFVSLSLLVLSVWPVAVGGRSRPVASVVAVMFAGIAFGALGVALAPQATLSWRGLLVALIGLGFPGAFAAATLRFDVSPDLVEATRSAPALSSGEVLQIAMSSRSRRRGVAGMALAGAVVFSLVAFLPTLLRDRWEMSTTASAAIVGGAFVAAMAGAATSVARGGNDRRASLVALLASLMTLGALAIGDWQSGFVVLLIVAVGFLGASLASSFTAAVGEVGDASLVAAVAVAFASMNSGGAVGVLLVSTVDRRFGPSLALAVTAVPLVFFALTGFFSPAPVPVLAPNEEPPPELKADESTVDAPLLELRNVDVYYGAIQVLFNVNLRIAHDEIVALLGTNGAGKSTALKVIAGQILPRSGTVFLAGTDITGLSAERRVPLGLIQIPGGRAVFGPLTVLENLELFGSSLGQDRSVLKQGIEQTFRVFPRLEEHRHREAQTLSGGEQQMLALGKALLLSPRLLCIDELSLGLAPSVVADLLDLVCRIHADGTTVVLVEQSVNVALAIADRAIFMEKGEIRFDGPAAELRNRSDLLRSVFLQGAATD